MTENLTDVFNLFLAIYFLAIKPKHMFMRGIIIILHPLSSMVQSFYEFTANSLKLRVVRDVT